MAYRASNRIKGVAFVRNWDVEGWAMCCLTLKRSFLLHMSGAHYSRSVNSLCRHMQDFDQGSTIFVLNLAFTSLIFFWSKSKTIFVLLNEDSISSDQLLGGEQTSEHKRFSLVLPLTFPKQWLCYKVIALAGEKHLSYDIIHCYWMLPPGRRDGLLCILTFAPNHVRRGTKDLPSLLWSPRSAELLLILFL